MALGDFDPQARILELKRLLEIERGKVARVEKLWINMKVPYCHHDDELRTALDGM